ncbi:MAG: hypothetical protein HYT13_01575 [Candidatus Liptonbacteria bacterium]|nr:hypothetical protein [Candidatus Liptonbacteria bacterium]
MLQSRLFTKVARNFPKDEEAINAKLLTRAGFVEKVSAGVYSFLPLGLRVMRKIETIIREEMNALGGMEILMPALHPKENWETTGRWKTFDVLYKIKSREGKEFALGPTHEEIVVPLVAKFVNSYKDLPVYLYQIQDKFRDELRAKSGLLRGREFLMKDLYSFHTSEGDLDSFYEKMKKVYTKLFSRAGLKTRIVKSSGGTFSKYSHEFQVLTPVGEDAVFYCEKCDFAENKEIAEVKEGDKCPNCAGKIRVSQGIEVGNIFKLGTKFSKDFELLYKDEKGKENHISIGCYGIGLSRLMGAIVEIFHDEQGIIWPETVAPFAAHLIELGEGKSKKLYHDLQKAGIDVLYDDRNISHGEKLTEADLIGIPLRLVQSEKTGAKIEVKRRDEKDSKLMTVSQVIKLLQPTTYNLQTIT